MKPRRTTVTLVASALLMVFALACYVFYLKRQTVALLAARERPESAKYFDRMQEALK